MQLVILCAVALSVITGGMAQNVNTRTIEAVTFECDVDQIPGSVCYHKDCTMAITNQISVELNAAFTYMYIAALFDDNQRARPGLAKFLYEAASEERQHAIMMLEYLNKRGFLYNTNYKFTGQTALSKIPSNPSYDFVLKHALEMEIGVTKNIHDIIEICDKDFHGAEYFTNPILEEQYDGMRKLQGAIKDLKNLKVGPPPIDNDSRAFAEYIFDKKILENGL